MIACQAQGGYNLFDAQTLAFLGFSYIVPSGAFMLPPGDLRCGGISAPAFVEPQKVLVNEPIATNTLLVGGAIAAGLIVLAAVI
jgi:hypothetical protein